MWLWTLVYTNLFKSLLSILLGKCPEVALLSHLVIQCLIFFKEVPFCLNRGCTIVHSQQQRTKVSISLHPCRGLFSDFVCGFDNRYPVLCVCQVVCHCGFDLRFCNDLSCWAFFCVFLGHLQVYFGERSIQVLCPFFHSLCCGLWEFGVTLLNLYGFTSWRLAEGMPPPSNTRTFCLLFFFKRDLAFLDPLFFHINSGISLLSFIF